MPTAQARPRFVVSDINQIDALASPVRQDIIDTLTALGPSTIAAIAEALRRPAAGLYYHVEQLEAVGLLSSTVEMDETGRSVVRLELPGEPMFLHYDPGDPHNKAAVIKVVTSMLRSAQRAFRRAFTTATAVVAGPRRNLWAGRMSGALSIAELEEFNRRLRQAMHVLEEARHKQRSPSTKLYEFTFVLAPTIASSDKRKTRKR